LLFGLAVGSVVLLIFLFGFFNERFIAPFIQPSRDVSNTPIISTNTPSGQEPKIIIPKINVEIPVVYGVKTVDDDSVNKALESGVVHYANTSLPGEQGNGVIVGHSSNNIFNKGQYKFAFVLLRRMENGDIFYLDKDGKRYTYQVYTREVVRPTDVSVLGARDKPSTITLITCDPPGTTANRLVVVGEQISPDPNTNLARSDDGELTGKITTIPGNAPSLWSRLVNTIF
jgi:sortase A